MSDRFARIPIERLLNWILAEEEQGQIFGIHRELFFRPRHDDVFRITRYGQLLETPIGVAAGPHTQLAQNIVAAWLCGARYMELKTVQTLDEIDVTKPCIDMQDEGYNCEWSQELTLADAFDEYLNAWILLHVLKHRFGWGDPKQARFIFNMSVGYDLAGILKPNVQAFLDRMTDCRKELDAKIESLAALYPGIRDLDIPDRISDNVTLSTMHGCPPDEIEKIGRYLIEERKLHTTIKLNPTLLGPEKLRWILNDKLGYEVQVPDEAFEHDLRFEDAVPIIESLRVSAEKAGVEFGLKLTNTLETINTGESLPPDERMVYLSGRALHPIGIHVAERLQNHFDGGLDISFCAGVDCFNVADTLACNLKPVTSCTDLLKPGGYARLGQYLEELDREIRSCGARSIDAFIIARNESGKGAVAAGWRNLQAYAEAVLENDAYHKASFPYENIKTPLKLTTFDCVHAPCVGTCAVGQDVPEYLSYTAQGDYEKAYATILKANPLPNITGMVCDHLCQSKCTRINYDNPLLIREIKRFVADQNRGVPDLKPAPENGLKTAIIGAGPSGLSCAYFLALSGFQVRVFESKPFAGGMAAGTIPAFRLEDESIQRDIEIIRSLGVQFHYNENIDRTGFERLRGDFDYLYVAAGAQRAKRLGIPGEEGAGVTDQLAFLAAAHRGQPVDLGKRVVVIGGGNSAVDAARTALRMVGKEGEVVVIYRRTRQEMPADGAEIVAMIEEGAVLHELAAPEAIRRDGEHVRAVVCSRMKLGEQDASGRPRPVKIAGSEFELAVDHVIPAIGQEAVLDFFPDHSLEVNPETNETQLPGVFAGGDAVRGADSLINAIGDGKRVAENILKRAAEAFGITVEDSIRDLQPEDYQIRQARRVFGPVAPELNLSQRDGFKLVNLPLDADSAQEEAARCLYCDDVCDICVTVCPNRANVAYAAEPAEVTIPQIALSSSGFQVEGRKTFRISQRTQILTLGDFCNECGNCTTFCPTSGSPYRDKPKFYLTEDSFNREDDGYFLDGNLLRAKLDGRMETMTLAEGHLMYETDQVRVQLDQDTFTVEDVRAKPGYADRIDLEHAAVMYVLLKLLKDYYPFNG